MDLLAPQNRNALAAHLAKIAQAAGQVLIGQRRSGFEAVQKADGSPVTSADLASEACILSALSDMFPDTLIISEENAQSHSAQPRSIFFLVDPLDGTKAFLAGGVDFCVLIALIVDGVPVCAAVDAPVLSKTWCVGETAFRVEGGALMPMMPPVLRPMGERIAIISAHHAGDETQARCRAFGAGTIRSENSALKFLRLAEGDADFYLREGPTMQWDVAAGDAFLRAMGGGVYDLDGVLLRYGPHASGWKNPGFLALSRQDLTAALG